MKTTAMLSMLLLAGTFYGATAGASDLRCDCRSQCRSEFSRDAAKWTRLFDQAKLGCHQTATSKQMACEVAYRTDRAGCKVCEPDYGRCLDDAREARSACRAAIPSDPTVTTCLTEAAETFDGWMKDCRSTRDTCLQGCQ